MSSFCEKNAPSLFIFADKVLFLRLFVALKLKSQIFMGTLDTSYNEIAKIYKSDFS